MDKKACDAMNWEAEGTSNGYMKKLFLLGVVMVGAATVAQAGVRLNFGIGIPLPGVVYSSPAPVYTPPPPVVYQSPPVVYRAPVYQSPPPAVYQVPPPLVYQAPPPVVYAPPPVVYSAGPSFSFGFSTGWWGGHHGWGHHGWHR